MTATLYDEGHLRFLAFLDFSGESFLEDEQADD